MKDVSVKKRIMFNKDDDHYFITYNIIIFLNTIGCVNEKSRFVDYTKLSYLIPFVSNSKLIDILSIYSQLERFPSKEEISLLQDTYIKGRVRIKLLTSILLSLESRNIIKIIKNERRKSFDIWLNKDNIPHSFLTLDLFKTEINNTLFLKKSLPRIKSLTNTTLLDNLFRNKGVRVWEI
ncbi:hypothetical protein H7S74_13280 [Priestia aryabhattai]|uniref:hypothetical protein n=1 Tax=Priestia aryabhattai TaxID=412384 RepID=UPI001EBB1EFB|nr:hypothetical protein [Priestia aryabhattai]MBY0091422.1 hypothetical protein [Priestia aryabhattai]MBY0102323.1 hypothetical protein [Priestia aryabhattai]